MTVHRSRAAHFVSIVVLMLVLPAGLVACGGDDDDEGDGAATGAEDGTTREVELLLSFPPSIAWVAPLVAQDQGFFEEEGLEVSLEGTEGSGFVTQQVISGNVDFGWAGSASDIIAFNREPELRTVMCDDGRNIFNITVPEGSDIQSVEDLEGNTLGITERGGGEEPLVTAALNDAGIEGNVELVPIGPGGPQSRTAIESGRVDAYAGAFEDIATIDASGLTLEDITPERFAGIPGDCFIMLSSALEDPETRDVVVGVASAWKRGQEFTQDDPQAALDIVCEAVPESCQDMTFAEDLLARQIELFQPADPDLEAGELDVSGWQTTADVLFETGTLEEEVDVTPMVDSPEVQSVVEDWLNNAQD